MLTLPYNINSIDWKSLTDIEFLTDIKPPRHFDYSMPFFYFFLFLSLVAIITMLINFKYTRNNPPRRRFFRSVWLSLLLESLSGLLLLLFRLYGFPFISARIWLVALLGISASTLLYFYDYYRKNLSLDIKKYETEKLRLKYLPKKKRR